MVGMDSLETRVWGLRNDVTLKSTVSDDSNRESNSFESHHLHGSSEDDAGVAGDSDHQTDSETEDLSETEDADTGESLDQSPPPSRSPSPSSLSTTSNSSSLRHHSPCSPSNRRPQRDHEEAEFSMRAAERLLSRTLASACAEDDEGRSLASEISPTQIHILLRAPRRFAHPVWTPRQNLSSSLDGYLDEFLRASGEVSCTQVSTTTAKRRRTNVRPEGVWIRSRDSSRGANAVEHDVVEEDESIWWSWDGKLVGFAEW